MSVYTTQLRWIVTYYQNFYGSEPDDYSKVYKHIGLDKYPIFDEQYRSELNDKIINHFLFREIGFETAEQFAFFMARTMNEEMPYFNKLYESESIVFDPISNRKYSWGETYSRTQGIEETKSGTSGSTMSQHVDDDLTHGKIVNDDKTTTFGKTTNNTNETERDRTLTDDNNTTYGKVQNTTNGGSDSTIDGATHERVIRSDTPMNQISNSGVENLNYASEVTYTDHEGVTGTSTTYGGTTQLVNSGADRTLGTTVDDDITKFDGTVSETGSEGVVTITTNSGVDQRDVDTSREESGTTSASGNTDLDESGERSHTVFGYDGIAPSDLLNQWRKTFLNIDMQVIYSLETLFMGLWN